MGRHFKDWLEAYQLYAGITEAPVKMHTWTGISTIASVLKRRVWIDMVRWRWYPSLYVILVAPPGVVAKGTTAGIGMRLLQEIPGVNIGPDIITWQALVQYFSTCAEQVEIGGVWHTMSALTLVGSELGNLINPQDRDMLNLYIKLYDGENIVKNTKTSGCDVVENPWLTMIGCTTPNWIADNMPLAAIGGGFTSRCIFVYAEKKDRYVAFGDEMIMPEDDQTMKRMLVEDLKVIAGMGGKFSYTDGARVWARQWYEHFWETVYGGFGGRFLEGYAGRKYTHLNKVAMILAVSQRDELVIEERDLQLASILLEELEPDMEKVFSQIGKTAESGNADVLLNYVRVHGEVPYTQAYRHVFALFPSLAGFEGVVAGMVKSGQMKMKMVDGEGCLEWLG